MESTVKERLIIFIKHKNLSQAKFEKTIGVANGFVNNISRGIGGDKLQRILCEFPELNYTWLMTGEGDMLKGTDDKMREQNMTTGDLRPFFDICAALGKPDGFAIAIKQDECDKISIPFVSDYDFSIKGRGDSMINRKSPERSIYDGDIIACRLWRNRSYIMWGQLYALATSSGIVVKQIKMSEKEDCVKCVSFNEEDGYLPYDMPLDEIHDWAIVVYVSHTSKW